MTIPASKVDSVIAMAVDEYKTRRGSAHAYRIAVKIVAAKVVKEAHSLGSFKDGLSKTPEEEVVFIHDVEDKIISALKAAGAKDDYIEVLRQEFIDSEKKYKLKGN
jgi:hypothetical protein